MPQVSKMLLASVDRYRDAQGERLSRVLHDHIGQILSAAGLQIDLLRIKAREYARECEEELDSLQRKLDQAITSVRALSYQASPAIAERIGLGPAIEQMIANCAVQDRQRVVWNVQEGPVVEGRPATALYRIAEEALKNSLEHSEASRIDVRLGGTAKSASVSVRDNGKGFDAEQVYRKRNGLGLLMMQFWAEQADVKLSITSRVGGGTSVQVKVANKAPHNDKAGGRRRALAGA